MKKNKRPMIIITLVILTIITGCGAAVETTPGTNAAITLDTNTTTSETTPPTILSTYPSNTMTDVAVNAAITATFSETINASTITTATFTLNNGVTGTVTYSGNTATFMPSDNLAYSTTYIATISTGVQNSAGNSIGSNYTWTFTTGVISDTTPPMVSSTTPSNGVTDVAVNTTIKATFSEAIAASTITTAVFTLDNGVTGIVTYSDKTATFTPSSNLVVGTTYTAKISTEVKDVANNAMLNEYTWTFTTGGNSAKLTWSAPLTNADGSLLTDLAGYKIYYGTSSGNYASSVDIGNSTTYTVSSLSTGIYYFSVRAYDSHGNESDYSEEISKIIP